MPNQLSNTKVRKSITEHKAVIAILNEIAKNEEVPVMELMKQSIRNLISEYIDNSVDKKKYHSIIEDFSPNIPNAFQSKRELSSFKHNLREFDKLLLDLHLSSTEEIERQNSLIPIDSKIKIMELD